LSRIEETTGFSAGISANATWLGVAFAVGVLARGVPAWRAACAGALALTAANGAYYAWIACLQPDVALEGVAGPPAVWLALGVGGGAVFATAGWLWAVARGPVRVLASLPLAGVCVAEGISALLGGPLSDGVALVIGAALPIASGGRAAERLLGVGLAAGVVAIALTGRLEALMP
jgi:hypothetical protein